MSFYCPKCDGKTQVYETRVEMRRRLCKECGHKFVTEEIECSMPMCYPRKYKRKK